MISLTSPVMSEGGLELSRERDASDLGLLLSELGAEDGGVLPLGAEDEDEEAGSSLCSSCELTPELLSCLVALLGGLGGASEVGGDESASESECIRKFSHSGNCVDLDCCEAEACDPELIFSAVLDGTSAEVAPNCPSCMLRSGSLCESLGLL